MKIYNFSIRNTSLSTLLLLIISGIKLILCLSDHYAIVKYVE